MKPPKPTLRNGTYYLRRRVPDRYRAFEDRRVVHVSLHTDSRSEAETRIRATWQGMIDAWDAMAAGDTATADTQMAAARALAKSKGFSYLPASRVVNLPIGDLLDRLEAATNRQGKLDRLLGPALLGTVSTPKISITGAWDVFWKLTESDRDGMTPDQVRIWTNPRHRAIRFMAEVLGDMPLTDLGQDEMMDYRERMYDRVKTTGIQKASVNKEMGHAFHIIRTVNVVRRMGLKVSFAGMMLSHAESNTRQPFSETWIKDRLLAPGALDGLNLQARCILLGMVNTGYRPSEGAGLRGEDIRLDTDIPHIHINATHRKIKTRESERTLPLLGVSLDAFRACPDGFPRYRDKSSHAAVINNFLSNNGLRETPEHSLYGLRHSFEDRLLNAGVDERIRRDLMGHKLRDRERYGAGARLSIMADMVRIIAF